MAGYVGPEEREKKKKKKSSGQGKSRSDLCISPVSFLYISSYLFFSNFHFLLLYKTVIVFWFFGF